MSTTNPTASAPREVVNPDVSCPGAPPSIGHNSGGQLVLDLWREFDACHEASEGAANAVTRLEGQVVMMRRKTADEAIKAGRVLVRIKAEVGHGSFVKECAEHGVSNDNRKRYMLLGEWLQKAQNAPFDTIGEAIRAAENERDRHKAEEERKKAAVARASGDDESAAKVEEKAVKLEKKVRTFDTVAKVMAEDPSLPKKDAEKAAKVRIRKEDRDAAPPIPISSEAPVYCCAVANLHQHVEAGSVDAIVTDPPYLREFIPVYGDLAWFAVHALRPGGLLLAIAGHPYVFDIGDLMRVDGLRYRWSVAYYQPNSSQLVHSAKVSVHWKPIVVFHKEGGTSPDGYSSDWIDKGAFKASDKDAHDWGQSVQGMGRLMREWVKEPGSLVCDPFCGAGSTLVAARALGHRVIGADIDEGCVNDTRGALAESAGVGAWPEDAPRDVPYYDTDRPRRPRGPPPGLGLRLLELRRGAREGGNPAGVGAAA